jgi:hypothetical protein
MTVWDIPEDSPSGSTAYLGVSRDEWRERMARRATRWAAEDAARHDEWERALLARAAVRSAAWPVDRIRAAMTAHREENGDDLAGP